MKSSWKVRDRFGLDRASLQESGETGELGSSVETGKEVIAGTVLVEVLDDNKVQLPPGLGVILNGPVETHVGIWVSATNLNLSANSILVRTTPVDHVGGCWDLTTTDTVSSWVTGKTEWNTQNKVIDNGSLALSCPEWLGVTSLGTSVHGDVILEEVSSCQISSINISSDLHTTEAFSARCICATAWAHAEASTANGLLGSVTTVGTLNKLSKYQSVSTEQSFEGLHLITG